MIGFNGLGKHGRLGNQMFQYAALKGIAAKHNYDWCIPPSEFNNADYDHQLLKIFNLYSLQNIHTSKNLIKITNFQNFEEVTIEPPQSNPNSTQLRWKGR